MRDQVKMWIRVLVAVLAVLAVVNVLYTEHQLDEQRENIQNILG